MAKAKAATKKKPTTKASTVKKPAAKKAAAKKAAPKTLMVRAIGKARKVNFVAGKTVAAYCEEAGINPASGEFYWAGANKVSHDHVVQKPGTNISVGKKAVNG